MTLLFVTINETDSTYEIVDDAYFSHVPFIIKYSNLMVDYGSAIG